MIISDLNYMEVASESAKIQGGTGTRPISFSTTNKFKSEFTTNNNFSGYTASGGASGDAVVAPGTKVPKATYTKADSTSYVNTWGDSSSTSTSGAAIKPY